MELEEIRKKIDSVDEKLIHQFCKRMELCARMAEFKQKSGMPVLDTSRESAKLEEVRDLAGEYGNYACELYSEIFNISRSLQKSQAGVFGLLGGKLGHSYSPEIHKLFGGYDYQLFEKTPDELENFLRKAPFDGINVTIPYKKAVIPYCSELSQRAARIGSVNTITKLPDGTLRGDNSDYFGFEYLVRAAGVGIRDKKCLVLGDGGVAATVKAVLAYMEAGEIVTVSRRGQDNYDNISRHYDADVIVNTTPVGMYPNNGQSAVELTGFDKLSGVLDVVYNPSRTKLILDAEERGIPCSGGLSMLVAQAKSSCESFTGRRIPDSRIAEVTGMLEAKMKNVAIIGMPGCGKTTAGKALAELTGRGFVDMDAEIVKRAGCSIPDIFAKFGEQRFREIETEVLADTAKHSGLIIATGGGVVTRPENYRLLHQNSTIVFLDRKDLASLSQRGRPISQIKLPEQIAEERMHLYTSWCDATVECVSPKADAKNIAEALGL